MNLLGVLNLNQVNIDLIGSSMNPVMMENMQCTCIKKEVYEEGDVIFFFQEHDGQTMGITHRIVENNIESSFVLTKGDNNMYIDKPVNKKNIVCMIPLTMRWRTW